MAYSVEWVDNHVRMLDQRLLPHVERYVELHCAEDVAEAIRNMTVRGAPAIGVAAAYGVALASRHNEPGAVLTAIEALAGTRPTAVNLFAALDRMRRVLADRPQDLASAMLRAARLVHQDEIDAEERICRLGASLIPDGATVLTHCNAGMIATAAGGTALGAIVTAHHQGKQITAIATETRPLLQGARLTAWELVRAGVPTTLITDSMVAHMLRTTRIDCVMVGADRISANGDVANKIGTYGIALLAHAHGVPFYVAAPMSTVDLKLTSGDSIAIEERNATEITWFGDTHVAADGVQVRNPAFDVTPHHLVTSIVTDRGILSPPYKDGFTGLSRCSSKRRS